MDKKEVSLSREQWRKSEWEEEAMTITNKPTFFNALLQPGSEATAALIFSMRLMKGTANGQYENQIGLITQI